MNWVKSILLSIGTIVAALLIVWFIQQFSWIVIIIILFAAFVFTVILFRYSFFD